jgi:hypothetical protein
VQKCERERISERLRRRWKDCIKTALKELGWEKWIDVPQDRDNCQTVVDTARQLSNCCGHDQTTVKLLWTRPDNCQTVVVTARQLLNCCGHGQTTVKLLWTRPDTFDSIIYEEFLNELESVRLSSSAGFMELVMLVNCKPNLINHVASFV